MTMRCPVCGDKMATREHEPRMVECPRCGSAATTNVAIQLAVCSHKLANVQELLKAWMDRIPGVTHTEHPQECARLTYLQAVQALHKALES